MPLVPPIIQSSSTRSGHVFGGEQQRFVAIAGGADGVTFAAEAIFDQFGEGEIVFDQEQLGGRHVGSDSADVPCEL